MGAHVHKVLHLFEVNLVLRDILDAPDVRACAVRLLHEVHPAAASGGTEGASAFAGGC